MPRGDGTGPLGMGPMTGRAAGYCAGFAGPGFANPVPGRGGGARPRFGGSGAAVGRRAAPAGVGRAGVRSAGRRPFVGGRAAFGRGRGFRGQRGRGCGRRG
ncbi:MAG: DUF5320 domain-containing protein [Planctomycetota bacterium]